jgi:predicted O-linked N-acetylglucosamine transferase (SPINDLY family)
MALLMKPDMDAHELLREHTKWDEQYARPLKRLIQLHTENRDTDRRLRIGYVSPDFRDHVVGWNLLALLSNHDREKFEIYCYASLANPDAMSEKIYKQIHTWRNILGANDDQAAEVIRQDKIDILVDLSMHSGGNRLLVFARKPAPVQVTYLGYAGTTGMEAIDYRLSDPYLDPPETDLTVYSEKTIRLPHTYWCYQPGGATPEVTTPPSIKNGYITFGCLNNFAKVSAEAMKLWGRLLATMPNSRLLLHCPSQAHWQPVLSQFAEMGINADRIELVGRQKFPGYIETYGRIDIALDPFPYGGAITTCDSLWMGVPVVTLSGRTAVGRAAQSILCNVGLPELVAKMEDEYIQIAASLAGDPARLESLRASLRQRMADSPVMNTKQFARDIEAAYRMMWKTSC